LQRNNIDLPLEASRLIETMHTLSTEFYFYQEKCKFRDLPNYKTVWTSYLVIFLFFDVQYVASICKSRLQNVKALWCSFCAENRTKVLFSHRHVQKPYGL